MNADTRLDALLRLALAELEAEQVTLGTCPPRSARLEVLAAYPEPPEAAQQQFMLDCWPAEPGVWSGSGSIASALLIPIQPETGSSALLAFFSTQEDRFRIEDAQRIDPLLGLLALALEHRVLQEMAVQTQSLARLIRQASQSLVDTPQNLLEVLCEDLLRHRYTTCTILLYGPVREDRPQGRFDYLEVAASWSRRHGYGAAMGTRFYLPQELDYLAALEAGETLVVDADLAEFSAQMDPFIRAFLDAERVRALALIPLNAGPRKIGLLFVATSRNRIMSAEEIEFCQTISEFITLSAMTQLLQQQRDLIQWGRAALLDAVTNGVVMVLPDAEGARVLTVNQVFTGMFGPAQTEVQGLLLPEMLDRMRIPRRVSDELRQLWLRVPVRDTARQHGEFHMVHSEGHALDVAWYSGPVYQGERVIGRIYTFQDVTAERAAIAMRATFLSRISHELRTPLTSIQGYAQLILELAGDDLPPVAREFARTILASSVHLHAVFDDIIELSRADAGQIQLSLMPITLPEALAQAVSRCRPRLESRRQQIRLENLEPLPPVMADVNYLMQALHQLLSNAIKFSPPDSTI